jgi:hypothetical protein
MAGPRHPGRPKERAEYPLHSREIAETELSRRRPVVEEREALLAMVRFGAIGVPAIQDLWAIESWLWKLRDALVSVGEPPPLKSDPEVLARLQELDFLRPTIAVKLGEVVAAARQRAKDLVVGIPAILGAFSDPAGRELLAECAKTPDNFGAALAILTAKVKNYKPLDNPDLSLLMVVAGLEAPTDEHEKRENTWGARQRNQIARILEFFESRTVAQAGGDSPGSEVANRETTSGGNPPKTKPANSAGNSAE